MQPDATQLSINEAVNDVWTGVLGRAFDQDLSWEESGGDSLGMMHVLLQLESRLGRKIPYDALAPDMTSRDFAQKLLLDVRQDGQAPVMFLCPGMWGDEPSLANFRRSFSGRLGFQLIDHPAVSAPRALLINTSLTGKNAAREIERHQPQGDILLAGFSYGGRVAFEAAQYLSLSGRRIACLAILDSSFGRSVAVPRDQLTRNERALLAIGRIDSVRRWALRLVKLIRPDQSNRLERAFSSQFRKFRNTVWDPGPLLHVPVLLVLTDDSSNAVEARWQQLCSNIEVLRVPANHKTLFKPVTLELIKPAIEFAALIKPWRLTSPRHIVNPFSDPAVLTNRDD